MINLLPIENKISIKREYLRRLSVIFGALSFAVIIIAALLLAFLLFLVSKEKNDYGAYLSLEQEHLSFLDEEVVSSFVSETNARVVDFEKNTGGKTKASETIKSVIDAKTKGTTIDNFYYFKDKISFSGVAQTRNDLQLFVDNLKKVPAFQNIDSPISNFLKERDIDFNITAEFYEK